MSERGVLESALDGVENAAARAHGRKENDDDPGSSSSVSFALKSRIGGAWKGTLKIFPRPLYELMTAAFEQTLSHIALEFVGHEAWQVWRSLRYRLYIRL